jgi:uncharacterized protein (DUF433 family)
MIMGNAARLYTPTEAAAVSGVGVKAVNNAIDKRIVKIVVAKPSKGGKRLPRKLAESDLLRLKLWYEVGDTLTKERRLRLFRDIAAQPNAKQVRADDFVIIDVAEARKQISDRVRELEAANAAVVQDDAILGGEPVFKGTRIPVRLIASMLADGVGEDEILSGYPKLDSGLLLLARLWVAAHPRRGRPKLLKERGYKPTSSKRMSLGSSVSA